MASQPCCWISFLFLATFFSGSSYCSPQQHYDHHTTPYPIILNHKQSLSTDGAFQYSFAADNGLQQGESIHPDGSRRGSYQYVDPNGKTITVQYTADKNGFHVQGDHLPRPVQPLVPQAAAQHNNYQQEYDDYDSRPRYQGGPSYGPAQFPPSPPRQAAPAFPKPYYSPSGSSQYRSHDDDDDDYVEPPVDPNKPHSFGDGYAFQFSG